MTLFDDKNESDYRRAISLVESSIDALGLDPSEARAGSPPGASDLDDPKGARWALKRGSASLLVSVLGPTEAAPKGFIRVAASVVRVPDSGAEALYARLLRANVDELIGVAFGLIDQEVVLLCERTLEDLDRSEVDTMIRTVGRDADRFDDLLAKEFDAVRAADA